MRYYLLTIILTGGLLVNTSLYNGTPFNGSADAATIPADIWMATAIEATLAAPDEGTGKNAIYGIGLHYGTPGCGMQIDSVGVVRVYPSGGAAVQVASATSGTAKIALEKLATDNSRWRARCYWNGTLVKLHDFSVTAPPIADMFVQSDGTAGVSAGTCAVTAPSGVYTFPVDGGYTATNWEGTIPDVLVPNSKVRSYWEEGSNWTAPAAGPIPNAWWCFLNERPRLLTATMQGVPLVPVWRYTQPLASASVVQTIGATSTDYLSATAKSGSGWLLSSGAKALLYEDNDYWHPYNGNHYRLSIIKLSLQGVGTMTVREDRNECTGLRLFPSDDVMVACCTVLGEVKVSLLSWNGSGYTVNDPEIDAGVTAESLGQMWLGADGMIYLPYTDTSGDSQVIKSDLSGQTWTPA